MQLVNPTQLAKEDSKRFANYMNTTSIPKRSKDLKEIEESMKLKGEFSIKSIDYKIEES